MRSSRHSFAGRAAGVATCLAVGVAVPVALGSRSDRLPPPKGPDAASNIRSAIDEEEAALDVLDRNPPHFYRAHIHLDRAMSFLGYAMDQEGARWGSPAYSFLYKADAKDANAKKIDSGLWPKSKIEAEIEAALVLKKKALLLVEHPATASNSLTSPEGSGQLTVTKVACYIGTGGNAERDADLSLSGKAGWHFQQVYPASYIPGGSQSAPAFFLEHGPPPYTAPGTVIYDGFGVTVSGDVGMITSAQKVTVKGSLLDAKGAAVAGSSIKLSFACPK